MDENNQTNLGEVSQNDTNDEMYFNGVLKRQPGTAHARSKGRYTEEYKTIMREYHKNYFGENVNSTAKYFQEPVPSIWHVLGVKFNKASPETKRLRKEAKRLKLEARRSRILERAKALDHDISNLGGVEACTKVRSNPVAPQAHRQNGYNPVGGTFPSQRIPTPRADSSFLARSLSEIDNKIAKLIEARTQLVNLAKLI